MRTFLVGFAAVLCIGFSITAQAENRMFIVASDADGYGVDRCLSSGDKCGAAAANAYCKVHEFVHAAAYRKADPGDITGGVSTACHGASCDVVAIVCTR